jgi:hypothetical protein
MHETASPPPLRYPLPSARVLRRRQSSMRHGELFMWFAMMLVLVVLAWYALSLPVPRR